MRLDIMWAVARRKLTSIRRDHRTAVFVLVMPSLVLSLFGVAFGSDPIDLDIAVVNQDAGTQELQLGATLVEELQANHSDTLTLHFYDSIEEAVEDAESGNVWGVIHIREGLSRDLPMRVFHPNDPSVIENSTVSLRLDKTNQQIAIAIQNSVFEALTTTVETETGVRMAPPLESDESVFGTGEPRFIDFLAPGMITYVCFVFSLILTAMTFVNERYDGTLERMFSAGVKPSEVVMGHMVAWSSILLAQVIVMLTVIFTVFSVPIEGSIFLVLLLVLLLGLAAMCFGMFISSKANSEFQAFQLSLATFLPVFLLSGIFWPVEAIPMWLRWVSYIVPPTWVGESMRSIMLRGHGFESYDVIMGFLIVGVWMILFLFLATRSLRVRVK